MEKVGGLWNETLVAPWFCGKVFRNKTIFKKETSELPRISSSHHKEEKKNLFMIENYLYIPVADEAEQEEHGNVLKK